MLVISRNINETIHLGDDVKIVVLSVRGNRVRIGIDAPKEIPIHRKEVFDKIHGLNSNEPTRS
jgi:carbon storage regulator